MVIDSPEVVDILDPIVEEIRQANIDAFTIENSIREIEEIDISLEDLQRRVYIEEETPEIKPSYLFFPEGEEPRPLSNDAHEGGHYEHNPWIQLEREQADGSRHARI